MAHKRVFVTVGTTEFNELIEQLLHDESTREKLLNSIGCKELIIQHGRGKVPDVSGLESSGISVECYDLKPSISGDIAGADLIIGHAGAGTCIEALNAGKPLIVVTNDTLMDQHQSELAQRLHEEGYLACSTLANLCDTLDTFSAQNLKKYENGNVTKFIEYLDDFVGFV